MSFQGAGEPKQCHSELTEKSEQSERNESIVKSAYVHSFLDCLKVGADFSLGCDNIEVKNGKSPE